MPKSIEIQYVIYHGTLHCLVQVSARFIGYALRTVVACVLCVEKGVRKKRVLAFIF